MVQLITGGKGSDGGKGPPRNYGPGKVNPDQRNMELMHDAKVAIEAFLQTALGFYAIKAKENIDEFIKRNSLLETPADQQRQPDV